MAIVDSRKDKDFRITSIEYFKKNETKPIFDLFSNNSLNNDYTVLGLIESINKEILGKVISSNDYGMDPGLVYANILCNIDPTLSKNILCYKNSVENFENNNVYEAIKYNFIKSIKNKIARCDLSEKKFNSEKEKNEYLSQLKDKINNIDFDNKVTDKIILTDKIIQDINREFSINIEIGDLIEDNTVLVPNFSIEGHVFLTLYNPYISQDKFFNIDTIPRIQQPVEGAINIMGDAVAGDLQTTDGGGCCGFWVSELCKEYNEDKNTYKDLLFKNTSGNPEINKDLLKQLVLNAAIKVSEQIDGSGKCPISKIGEFYSIKENATSKCINITSKKVIEFLDLNKKQKQNVGSYVECELDRKTSTQTQSGVVGMQ